MWAKFFAVLEAVKILRDLWVIAQEKWVEYLISKHSGELDQRFTERSVYLDAIKQAQWERDEEKAMHYHRLLVANELPKS
jgi:hypothetical protein